MKRFILTMLQSLALTLVSGLSAVAQTDTNLLPNPLQRGNLTATCNSLPEQNRAADPQAMQILAGVWETSGVEPGAQGIIGDTPLQIQTQISMDGSFRQDRYGCFQPFNIDGSLMAPSCANSFTYGEWSAHFGPDNSIVMITLSSGSGWNGGALPMSCAASYFRQQDANTLIDMAGNPIYRIGN